MCPQDIYGTCPHHTYAFLLCSMNTASEADSVLPTDVHPESGTCSDQKELYSPSSGVKCRPLTVARDGGLSGLHHSDAFSRARVTRPQRVWQSSSAPTQAPQGACGYRIAGIPPGRALQVQTFTSTSTEPSVIHPDV